MTVSMERLKSVMDIRNVSEKELEDECTNGIALSSLMRGNEIPANVLGKISSYLDCPADYITMKSDVWDVEKTTPVFIEQQPARKGHTGPRAPRTGYVAINFSTKRLTERRMAMKFSNVSISWLAGNNKDFWTKVFEGKVKSIKRKDLIRLLYYLQADIDYLNGTSLQIREDKIPRMKDLEIPEDWVYFERMTLHSPQIKSICEATGLSYHFINRMNCGNLYCPKEIADKLYKPAKRYNPAIIYYNQMNRVVSSYTKPAMVEKDSKRNCRRKEITDEFIQIVNEFQEHKIVGRVAAEKADMSIATFYKYMNMYLEQATDPSNPDELVENQPEEQEIQDEIIDSADTADDNEPVPGPAPIDANSLVTYLEALDLLQLDCVIDICQSIKAVKEAKGRIDVNKMRL